MAKCNHCSAPLPHDSIICNYCGTRNDIELTPKVGNSASLSKRTCPDCLVFLESVDIGDNDRFIVEKCPRCFGLFFDNHELEALLEKSTGNSYWINHKKLHSLLQYPLHKDIVQYRKCPECSSIMHRKNYMNRSGVIMDVCIKHGVWLDAGELKQIQEWRALGGKEYSEETSQAQERSQVNASRANKRVSKHYEEKVEKSTPIDAALEILDALLRWH